MHHPLQLPKNFKRILIFLMVLEEIWAISCRKLLRICTPRHNFIQLIGKSLKIQFPIENPKIFNRFLISLTVLEKWEILFSQ